MMTGMRAWRETDHIEARESSTGRARRGDPASGSAADELVVALKPQGAFFDLEGRKDKTAFGADTRRSAAGGLAVGQAGFEDPRDRRRQSWPLPFGELVAVHGT